MRIEAYNQVQQMYKTGKAGKTQETSRAGASDQLQISDTGKGIQTAKQAVANAPDIRLEITAPIKAAINSGTYNVSGESFAEKLVDRYNEFNEMR